MADAMGEREWSPIKLRTLGSPTRRRASCFFGDAESPPPRQGLGRWDSVRNAVHNKGLGRSPNKDRQRSAPRSPLPRDAEIAASASRTSGRSPNKARQRSAASECGSASCSPSKASPSKARGSASSSPSKNSPSRARRRRKGPAEAAQLQRLPTDQALVKAVSALVDPEATPRIKRVFTLEPERPDWDITQCDLQKVDVQKLVVREKDFQRFHGDMRKLRQCEVKPEAPSPRKPLCWLDAKPALPQPPEPHQPCNGAPPCSPRALFETRCRAPAEVSDPWSGMSNPEKCRPSSDGCHLINQIWLEPPPESGSPAVSLTTVAAEEQPAPSPPATKPSGPRSPMTSRPVAPAMLVPGGLRSPKTPQPAAPATPAPPPAAATPKQRRLSSDAAPAPPPPAAATPKRRASALPTTPSRPAAAPPATPRRPATPRGLRRASTPLALPRQPEAPTPDAPDARAPLTPGQLRPLTPGRLRPRREPDAVAVPAERLWMAGTVCSPSSRKPPNAQQVHGLMPMTDESIVHGLMPWGKFTTRDRKSVV